MDISEAVSLARSKGVLFNLSETYGLLALEGQDRVSFLQALTCNDVNALDPGQGQHNAFLTPKSYIKAEFWLYREDQKHIIVSEKSQLPQILKLFNQFHFNEDIRFKDISGQTAILAVQGPSSLDCLKVRLSSQTALESLRVNGLITGQIQNVEIRIVQRSFTGEAGYLLLCDIAQEENLINCLTNQSLPPHAHPCSLEVLNVLRTESGIPVYGKDMDETTMLLEIGLDEEIVDLDKGCFPGQEIVARTKSRGQLQKKLMGLKIKDQVNIPPGESIQFNGKTSGPIKSGVWSPTLNASIYFAYLNRNLQSQENEIEIQVGDQKLKATVCRPPFYVPPGITEKAKEEYTTGMNLYHHNDYPAAQEHFEKAIAINSHDSDAHEALSVVLEKTGNIDGAIVLNKKFAYLDPKAVMARTNLSRLYMLKGWKEKAEEEQAKATAIGWTLAAKGHKQKTDQDSQEKKKIADQERRLDIFKQVLEMDAEDEVANFGLGQLYLETGKYEDSIQALKMVINNNEQYSAAYALLGSALKKNNHSDEAMAILKKGISIAGAKGDLMPKNSMEEELKELRRE